MKCERLSDDYYAAIGLGDRDAIEELIGEAIFRALETPRRLMTMELWHATCEVIGCTVPFGKVQRIANDMCASGGMSKTAPRSGPVIYQTHL